MFNDFRTAQKHANEFPAEQYVVRSDRTTDSDIHHVDADMLTFDKPNQLTNRDPNVD
jgi:hypothetical protein